MKLHSSQKALGLIAIILIIAAIIYFIQDRRLQNVISSFNDPETVNGLLVEPESHVGKEYLIPKAQIHELGITSEDLPFISAPKYESVNAADEMLADDLYGISVQIDGETYFYPFQILNWHYAALEGDLLITHDLLTLTPQVYKLNGQEFKHAGLVYNNNSLFEDQDGNYWLQGTGMQVAGMEAGSELEKYPFDIYKWSVWKNEYSDGNVLSMESSEVDRDYTQHPYGQGYDDSERVLFPVANFDSRVAYKWVTNGITVDGEHLAFLQKVMLGVGVGEYSVNEKNIVGFYDQDNELTNIFFAEMDGQQLTFIYSFAEDEIRDNETNSIWNSDGLAISGELEGNQLKEIQSELGFWYAYSSMHDDAVLIRVTSSE